MKKLLICLVLVSLCHLPVCAQSYVVINEILFNPVKEGFDYVEGYNRGAGIIYLSTISIGNGASSKRITKDSIPLPPGALFVITANEQWLKEHYNVPVSAIVCQVSSMPSLPDDEGTLIFMNSSDSTIIDRVDYSAKWHSPLVTEEEGVSLERISYDYHSNDKNNWTSASASSGSGTPGQVNSQHRENDTGNEGVSVLPAIFTPDNDGSDDFVQVSVEAAEPGKTANAIVYDVFGRRVRYLIRNEVLGISNRFTWDGCDDRSNKLPTGIYIVCTQVFDTKGNVGKFKNCVVLSNLRK